jgi:hypothetical protein
MKYDILIIVISDQRTHERPLKAAIRNINRASRSEDADASSPDQNVDNCLRGS